MGQQPIRYRAPINRRVNSIVVFVSVIGPSAIDVVVVFGVAVILPLALGGRIWWWTAAAGSVAVSLLLPRGALAAARALPFAVAVLATALPRLGRVRRPARAGFLPLLPAAYALVAAGALAQSRAGLTLAGIREPIVELTAVHYVYAGAAALTLALRAPGRVAVALVAVAPPVVALGFVTGGAVPQVGGAVLMALGVCGVAALELRRAWRDTTLGVGRRLLLGASGLVVWAPMVLAVAWAAGQHLDVPVLPIPAMVRAHGVPNAVGFCLCGLLATRPRERRTLRGADGQPEGGHPWTSTSTTTASPAGST
jgi:hypothetical protein